MILGLKSDAMVQIHLDQLTRIKKWILAELNLDLQVDLVSLVNSCQTESPKSAILFLSPKGLNGLNFTCLSHATILGQLFLVAQRTAGCLHLSEPPQPPGCCLCLISNQCSTLASISKHQLPRNCMPSGYQVCPPSSLCPPLLTHYLEPLSLLSPFVPLLLLVLSLTSSRLKSLFSLMYELHEF